MIAGHHFSHKRKILLVRGHTRGIPQPQDRPQTPMGHILIQQYQGSSPPALPLWAAGPHTSPSRRKGKAPGR